METKFRAECAGRFPQTLFAIPVGGLRADGLAALQDLLAELPSLHLRPQVENANHHKPGLVNGSLGIGTSCKESSGGGFADSLVDLAEIILELLGS